MTSNVSWDRVPVSSVALGIFDGPHATPKPAAEGPVFLGIQNITEDGRIDLSNIRHISEEDYHRWTRRACPEPGDIVFTYEATLNRYAIIPEGFVGCLGRRVALIRPNPKLVHPRYLLAYFMGDEWREVTSRNVLSGSTVDRIPLTSFPEFEIALPPMSVQRTIASILSAYDDLIENNLRRIAILEEMARTIYREWFVEFRYPGHEDVSMVDSELGLIPEEWIVAELRTVATLIRNSSSPAKNPNTRYAHYSIPAFDAAQMPVMELGRDIRSTKYIIDGGCVLVSKLNPRIPRVWLPFVDDECLSISSTEFLVLSPVAPATRMFLYSLCLDERFLNSLAASASGTSTSHQRVKPAHVMSTPIVLPPEGLIRRFTNTVQPIYELAHTLREAVMRLGEIRDLLLPQLISGEFDVSNITIDTEEDEL